MKEITQEMLDRLLRAYRRLDERSDKLLDQAAEAERNGDNEDADKKSRLAGSLVDQMIGMETAASCIGYVFCYPDGELELVEREYE